MRLLWTQSVLQINPKYSRVPMMGFPKKSIYHHASKCNVNVKQVNIQMSQQLQEPRKEKLATNPLHKGERDQRLEEIGCILCYSRLWSRVCS